VLLLLFWKYLSKYVTYSFIRHRLLRLQNNTSQRPRRVTKSGGQSRNSWQTVGSNAACGPRTRKSGVNWPPGRCGSADPDSSNKILATLVVTKSFTSSCTMLFFSTETTATDRIHCTSLWTACFDYVAMLLIVVLWLHNTTPCALGV